MITGLGTEVFVGMKAFWSGRNDHQAPAEITRQKSKMNSSGFTMVEIMIVMAVTAVILVSALLLFSGKQATVEFNQAVNDIQAQVNQIINNVETGYYTKSADFNCTPDGTGKIPQISIRGTDTLGTNQSCIFLGKAIQLGVKDSGDNGFNVYNLIGLRNDPNTSNDVSSIQNANPVATAPGTPPNAASATDDIGTENDLLQYGLKVHNMYYNSNPVNVNDPVNNEIGSIAFLTNINGNTASGGSTTANLYAINSSALEQTATQAIDAIDVPAAANFLTVTNGVTICFDGDTSLFGVLTIGTNNGQLTSTLKYVNKPDPECP